MKPNTMTGDVAGDLRRGCFFGNLSDDARELLATAVELADEAAIAAIESHVRLTDWDNPGERGYDIAGEPVETDAAYLEGRGLLRRTPMAPTLVIVCE